jgi:hypothetical protein
VPDTGWVPRSNQPRRRAARRPAAPEPDPAALGRGPVRRESGPDGDWLVRGITGAAAGKPYRCPGCDQEIRPGVPHVVAWPDDGSDGVAVLGDPGAGLTDRRHWHTACWRARGRRGPRQLRGRGAPRY